MGDVVHVRVNETIEDGVRPGSTDEYVTCRITFPLPSAATEGQHPACVSVAHDSLIASRMGRPVCLRAGYRRGDCAGQGTQYIGRRTQNNSNSFPAASETRFGRPHSTTMMRPGPCLSSTEKVVWLPSRRKRRRMVVRPTCRLLSVTSPSHLGSTGLCTYTMLVSAWA